MARGCIMYCYAVCFIIDLYTNCILDNFMWFSNLGFSPQDGVDAVAQRAFQKYE